MASRAANSNEPLFNAPVVGVVAEGGIGFVEAVLAAHAAGAVVVQLRRRAAAERIAVTGVERIVEPVPATGWSTLPHLARSGDDAAEVRYSSGTTGEPTGAILTHGNIASTTARLVAAMAMDGGIREYIGVPVIHSFGLGRARAVAAVGGRMYVPPHGFDPSEIARLLERGEINAVSAVPTLWRVLIANADLVRPHGGAVKWIEIGSQAMARTEKEALKSLFPNARIVQHYGLTQASRTTFLQVHDAEGEQLDSVGTAAAPVEVRIDADGQIMVRGPHVARRQLRGAVVESLTDADGWLATADLGSLDRGYLYFRGRRDDQINCGGIKLDPESLEEAIADALPPASGLRGFAVARVSDPLRGDGILVAFEHGSGLTRDAVQLAAQHATESFGLNAGTAVNIVAVENLPRTANGKVQRALLGATYAPGMDLAASPLEARLILLWRTTLGNALVHAHDNFFDLGGDELLGHALIEKMIAAGVGEDAARRLWDGLSIAEIAALDRAPPDVGRRGEIEARILGLWREALGRDDIAAHESFYDVGGDSLAAIGLALSMERAGFDHDLARSILDGKTVAEIAELAAAAEAPAAPTAAPPRRKTQIALLSEGLNFVKGILIVAMCLSHWMPLYMIHFGLGDSLARKALQPFFSMGTPTLVFIFGAGVAVFHFRQYEASREAFRRNIRSGALLLFAALFLNTILDRAASGGVDRTFGAFAASASNGPFIYFLLATLSLPLWIGWLRRDMRTVRRLLGVGFALYAVYLVVQQALPPPRNDLMKAVNEILVGHWSLFQLSALSLFGVGTGLLVEMSIRPGDRRAVTLATFAPYGALMMAAGVVLSLAALDFGTWWVPHNKITLWSALFYAGLALAIVGHFEAISAWAAGRPAARLLIQITASAGVVLFPLYVLQSFVYHGAELIRFATGMPFMQVLTLCIAAFGLAGGYMVWRVYRLYYADRR